MPTDFALKTMNAVHRATLKLTGGRKGWTASAMPVIELSTVGRKTGNKHAVMLTSPLQLGDTYVVVASRGGDDRPPAWFLNLEANPNVDVVIQGKPSQAMTAHIATSEERAELWPKVIADHKNYAGYQSKTTREIPLVLLSATS